MKDIVAEEGLSRCLRHQHLIRDVFKVAANVLGTITQKKGALSIWEKSGYQSVPNWYSSIVIPNSKMTASDTVTVCIRVDHDADRI